MIYDRLFYMNITNKCNNHCVFCISESTKKRINPPKEILTSVKKINSEYLFSRNDLFIINGGEPTLSEEFIKILCYLLKTDINIRVYTNARHLKDIQFKPFLYNEKIHWVIPFYGLAFLHDKYTQTLNSFSETFDSVKLLMTPPKSSYSIKLLIDSIQQISDFETLITELHQEEKKIHISLLLHNNVSNRFSLARQSNNFIRTLLSKEFCIHLSNFPLCMLDADIQKLLKNYTPEYNTVVNNSYFIHHNKAYLIDYDRNHSWKTECAYCQYRILCIDNSRKYRALILSKTNVYLGEE